MAMKYLFYDSESVDIKHRYSFTFGYVVTDDKFNIITPCKDIIFNPDIPQKEWDWWAYRKLLKDSYPVSQILSAKPFSHYYKAIKKLFSDEEILCIGFEINEDVKYLLSNCDRYGLDPISFKYIDLRVLINRLAERVPGSLAREYVQYMQKPSRGAHISSVDAEMTMSVLRVLLKEHKIDLLDYVNKNQSLLGSVDGFKYGFEDNIFDIKNPREPSHQNIGGTRYKKAKEGREDFIDKWSINKLLFSRFLDYVEPNCTGSQLLKDKNISISLNYESLHFQNMLKLVQLITNEGGTYVKNVSLADVFVKEDTVYLGKDGNPKSCSRYKYVMETIEREGKDIKIIEFDEFLAILGITVEKLNAMPNIDVEYLKDDKYKKVT